MKIAVIDDERPSRSELIHQILTVFPDCTIKEADSGAAALELINNETFDLLFIDIELNDMEGTTLAAAARHILPHAQIVFATAYSQYAVKAFELGVSNYILKPFDPVRVRNVLEKCQKDMIAAQNLRKLEDNPYHTPAPPYRLAVNTNRTIVMLDVKDLIYIETENRGCILHTLTKSYTEKHLMCEYEKRLAPCGFFRIHKSYLVNVNYIAELFPWANNSLAIKMQGFEKTILPVGREKVKGLRLQLGIL